MIHEAAILSGPPAREWMEANLPGALAWATTVAVCSCGWHSATIHRKLAELDATDHLGRPLEVGK